MIYIILIPILYILYLVLPILERVYGNIETYFYSRKIIKAFPTILAIEMDKPFIFSEQPLTYILILENENLRLELCQYKQISASWDLKDIVFKNKNRSLPELDLVGFKDSGYKLDGNTSLRHYTLTRVFKKFIGEKQC